MKNFNYIILLFFAVLATGCEDVVNVDLPTAEPRLVIDAAINWQLGTTGNEQTVRLTTTAGFYDPNVPPVSGAEVVVTNTDDNTVFNFTENPGTGNYICTTFVPVSNANYKLTVNHNGENYTATEKLVTVVPIDKIEQKNDGGFTGDDIEIKIFFTDPAVTTNFYMLKYKPDYTAVPLYGITDDEFYQGNQFADFFMHEDLESGNLLDVTIHGISEQYYNYMNLLLDSADGGGPFSTTPAKLKGNIINTTNSKNPAFGYFRLSQTDTENYLVQ
jgi:hypothetical protein